jgi:hypothetical protein
MIFMGHGPQLRDAIKCRLPRGWQHKCFKPSKAAEGKNQLQGQRKAGGFLASHSGYNQNFSCRQGVKWEKRWEEAPAKRGGREKLHSNKPRRLEIEEINVRAKVKEVDNKQNKLEIALLSEEAKIMVTPITEYM